MSERPPEPSYESQEKRDKAAFFLKYLGGLPAVTTDNQNFYKELGGAMSVADCNKLMTLVEYSKNVKV